MLRRAEPDQSRLGSRSRSRSRSRSTSGSISRSCRAWLHGTDRRSRRLPATCSKPLPTQPLPRTPLPRNATPTTPLHATPQPAARQAATVRHAAPPLAPPRRHGPPRRAATQPLALPRHGRPRRSCSRHALQPTPRRQSTPRRPAHATPHSPRHAALSSPRRTTTQAMPLGSHYARCPRHATPTRSSPQHGTAWRHAGPDHCRVGRLASMPRRSGAVSPPPTARFGERRTFIAKQSPATPLPAHHAEGGQRPDLTQRSRGWRRHPGLRTGHWPGLGPAGALG